MTDAPAKFDPEEDTATANRLDGIVRLVGVPRLNDGDVVTDK